MSLRVEHVIRGNILCVRLAGELDEHCKDDVRMKITALIEKNKTKNLILNLNGLSFMDSSGLGVVLGRYKQIKALGGEMVICEIAPPVKRLFDMSGLFKIMKLESSEQTAFSILGVA